MNQQAVGTTKKRGRPKKNEAKKTARKETVIKKTATKKTGGNGTEGRKKMYGGKRGPTETAEKKEESDMAGASVSFEQFFIENLSLVTTGDSEDSE